MARHKSHRCTCVFTRKKLKCRDAFAAATLRDGDEFVAVVFVVKVHDARRWQRAVRAGENGRI